MPVTFTANRQSDFSVSVSTLPVGLSHLAQNKEQNKKSKEKQHLQLNCPLFCDTAVSIRQIHKEDFSFEILTRHINCANIQPKKKDRSDAVF